MELFGYPLVVRCSPICNFTLLAVIPPKHNEPRTYSSTLSMRYRAIHTLVSCLTGAYFKPMSGRFPRRFAARPTAYTFVLWAWIVLTCRKRVCSPREYCSFYYRRMRMQLIHHRHRYIHGWLAGRTPGRRDACLGAIHRGALKSLLLVVPNTYVWT